ncbi:MAG: MAC/perforin domain-containing protein [Cyanobacteria bacterium J06581_3]
MSTITFYNHGAYELELTNKKTKSKHAINKGSGVATTIENISVGDVFEVENKTAPNILYRPVFIGDGVTTIELKGNIPFQDQKLNFSSVSNIDFESNLLGIDLVKFNPRQVVNSFVSKPIFDGLNPSSIDYDYQGGKLVKTGMTYSATSLSKGSKEVKMTSNYSAFSQEWNISLGASATVPVKGGAGSVTGALDFGFNQFEEEERSSSNVYAYTREQKSQYEVSIDPTEAYLDTTFIIDVSKVNSVQDAERLIVGVYGTHYPTKVYYGGERSLYVSMSRSTYAKAKGFGIDVKAKLSASKPNVLTKVTESGPIDGTSTETSKGSTGSSQIGSGNAGFGFSENQKEREILAEMKTGYRSIGGSGGFDNWNVDEGNAVAIAVEMAELHNLIDPNVFKDGTSPDVLTQKKSYIKTAVENRLQALKALGKVIPAPRLYSITLTRLEVTHEVDDTDKRTRGKVTATITPAVEGFDGVLWHKPDFDEKNLSYKKGRFVTLNESKNFVQPPTAEGDFSPLEFTVKGDIEERDLVGGAERHTGQINASITSLAVGQEQEFSFDCKAYTTLAERGTIKVTFKIRRDPSEFDEPLFGFESKSVNFNPEGAAALPAPQAPVFDPDFYIRSYSDLVKAFGYPNPTAATNHWQTYGIKEGRRSSPAFDVQYYLNHHPDLQQAFGTDYAAVINHWLTYGITEGRKSAHVFDVQYYLGKYADLQQAFGNTNYFAAVNHWLTHGVGEGRQGSAAFDAKYYLSANPDVAKVYGASNYKGAIAHFVEFGFKEGRAGTKPIKSTAPPIKTTAPAGSITGAPVFDPNFYIHTYGDLREVFGYPNDAAAATHWQDHGIREGRRSSPAFDVQYYLNIHPDLQQAFGTDYAAVINHWLTHGINEGRKSSLVFDVQYYLNKYADLRQAFGSDYAAAVNHWLTYGVGEGRQGSANFAPKDFLSKRPDVAKVYGASNYKGVLAHYLEFPPIK